MQNYLDNSQEMDLYRYLTTAAAATGSSSGGLMWPPSYNYGVGGGNCYNTAGLFNDEETAEAKAVTASRIHHKEAEKRRRERINSHLDRLRSLLPCTTKTDKATLLSKVVQRVLELKRQTSELLNLDTLVIPSENDEFNVYIHNNNKNIDNQSNYYKDDETDNNNNNDDTNNKIVLNASICCEDRPDLFSDLNGVLDSLNLKTVRAEISCIGGRVQSLLVVSGDGHSEECAEFLRDALKGIVQRSESGSEERLKRRRRVFDSEMS